MSLGFELAARENTSVDISVNTLTNPVPTVAKRVFDLAFAGIMAVFLLPMLLSIAVIIKIVDPGPVFFVHRRIGRHGQSFGCLKFRTMRIDADRIFQKFLADNSSAREQWVSHRKITSDPRVTKFGALLRRSSLDELPQLINVIRGDMSLVGPRPVVQEELVRHYTGKAYTRYTSVRPGLTGLWQVSGRSNVSYDKRVELDCRYVDSMSLMTDVRLLIRTVVVIISTAGAF